MALRLNIKTRTALAISMVIAVLLVAASFILILTKQQELKNDIKDRARLFASLTTPPVCTGYNTYFTSGFYKFRELVRAKLALEPDVEKLLIINVSGKILFDSSELDEPNPQGETKPAERWIEDQQKLEAIKKLELTKLEGVDPSGAETFEIITPYLEDWGRHQLSVLYKFSYKSLGPNIRRLIYTTAGLVIVSIFASVLVSIALASRITRPLEELTAGAQRIADGSFDHRIAIESNDEIQILAEAFNHMTGRLKDNVQHLEESNKKLATVNEELKELDRMKSDLLANVSHELRTPLTAIKGYTDYILDRKLGPVSEKQEKGLVVVQKNLDRLSKTINALLDFSRMDMGRITLNIQPFNLLQLAEQIRTALRSEFEKRGLAFTTDIHPDIGPVIADREKISQVLENLVINAMKFTPEGGRITLSATRSQSSDRPAAEIRVADTGIGIPPSQIAKVFNRFHQVDGSTTRRVGGVGLGLAIVKSILDAHSTTISVESEEGHGTCFRFKLPFLDKVEAAREPRGGAQESLVLIVDDDDEIRQAVSAYLEEEGLEVITASTASAGADLAARRRPNLILLDLLLPDRSGLDLLATLKSEPATRDIPVLVLSVADETSQALSLGAAECLMKPVERRAVVSTVRRIIDDRGSYEATILVVDDEPDTVDLIRDTLRAEGYRVVVAYNGRRALEIIAKDPPDLMLLDIMMPELSGFEVLEAMAKDETAAAIPVVVLTARGDEVDTRRGLALGARRYMSKPFDLRALIAEVRRHVGERALRRSTL
jgi:signal transduction histidine kinase/DNA-binding response OmpR family regulator